LPTSQSGNTIQQMRNNEKMGTKGCFNFHLIDLAGKQKKRQQPF